MSPDSSKNAAKSHADETTASSKPTNKSNEATTITLKQTATDAGVTLLAIFFFPFFLLALLALLIIVSFLLSAIYQHLQGMIGFYQNIDWSSPRPWKFAVVYLLCWVSMLFYLRRWAPSFYRRLVELF